MGLNGENSLKEKILRQSRKLLLEEGYRNFSLRKVARILDVSATSIYIYFENKDHLVHELIDLSVNRLNQQLADTENRIGNPLERLEALARTYAEFALSNRREYQIIYYISTGEMSRYPKEKFRSARRGYEIITRTIREGVSKNLMEEDDPRMAAYIFWAQLHGVLSVVLTERLDKRIDQEEFIEQAIRHVLDGLHVRTAVAS